MASTSSPSDPAVITQPIVLAPSVDSSAPPSLPVSLPPAAPVASDPVSASSDPAPAPVAVVVPSSADAAAVSPVPTVSGAISPLIKVYNQSTVVQDADVQTMVAAINQLLPTFLDAWSLQSCTAQFVSGAPVADESNWTFVMLDDSTQAGALAYHTEEANGIIDGFVFCKDILASPGVPLYQDPDTVTVASALSHEIFETLCDPQCNLWASDSAGNLYSREVCDPVQDNLIVCEVSKQQVGLSDFVLPAFFDFGNTVGPYNYNADLTAPFECDIGGYIIYQASSVPQQIQGMRANARTLDSKSRNKFSRYSQRRGVPRFQKKGPAAKQKAKPMKR